MEAYIGQIVMLGSNFAPQGWALCNGQLLSIAQNTALFAVIGTTYGGDGIQTFALPNLQSRIPIHWGNGPGLTPYVIGEFGGSENVTLAISQMPYHNHTVNADAAAGNAQSPSGAILAETNVAKGSTVYDTYTTGTPTTPVTMANNAISLQGGNAGHPNIQPFLAVTFIIALVGIFPSRN